MWITTLVLLVVLVVPVWASGLATDESRWSPRETWDVAWETAALLLPFLGVLAGVALFTGTILLLANKRKVG